MIKRWLLFVWRYLPIPGWMRWLIIWLTIPKFLVGVVAVIFDDTGQILLFNHTYRRDYPWGLPSGWLDPGEYASDAIQREVYEESGLRVRAIRPFVVGGDRAQRRVDVIFLCEFVSGTFRPCAEVSDAKFFALDATPPLEPFHRIVIEQAKKDMIRTLDTELWITKKEKK